MIGWLCRLSSFVALTLVAGLVCGQDGQALQVTQLGLSMSNVHLVRSVNRVFLIDSGGRDDLPRLAAALAGERVRLEDVAAVVLTHGHADHAGLAAEIRRRSGAILIAGRGDQAMLAAGTNEPVTATSFSARLLLLLPIEAGFEPFRADVEVEGELDLRAYGLPGRALSMPGHTRGSLAVVLDDGRAFAGDMILGGWLGGALLPHRPGEHYFHMDPAANRANLLRLVQMPIRQYFLGHGGPVSQQAVREYLGPPAAR